MVLAAKYLCVCLHFVCVHVCVCIYLSVCLSVSTRAQLLMICPPGWLHCTRSSTTAAHTRTSASLLPGSSQTDQRCTSLSLSPSIPFLSPPPPYPSFLLPLHILPSTIPFFALPPPPCSSYQIFQPYAKYWLPGLVQLIVGGAHGGEGLHYFVVDLLVTILSWSTTAILEVRRRYAEVLYCKKFDGVLQVSRNIRNAHICMCYYQ